MKTSKDLNPTTTVETLGLDFGLDLDNGFFHVVAKIKRELKSHMIPYKFKCSHWLKLQHSDRRANLVKDFIFTNEFSTNEST